MTEHQQRCDEVEHVRLAFVGPSTSGKSLAARLLAAQVPGSIILSATAPLVAIEAEILAMARVEPSSVSREARREVKRKVRQAFDCLNVDIVATMFEQSLSSNAEVGLTINDDARMALLPILRKWDFCLVWVDRPNRPTSGKTDDGSLHDRIIEREDADYVLNNWGDLEALQQAVRVFRREFLRPELPK